jgi:hypothetical protein
MMHTTHTMQALKVLGRFFVMGSLTVYIARVVFTIIAI